MLHRLIMYFIVKHPDISYFEWLDQNNIRLHHHGKQL